MITMKRNNYIDIVKGFAMLMVVCGHCIQYGYRIEYLNSRNFCFNPVYMLIYSFHMPLFALISGYLFYYTAEKRTPCQVIRNRITSLVVPLVTFSTIHFIRNGEFLAGGLEKNIVQLLKQYVGTVIGTLWFLWVLIFCSVIIMIQKYIFRERIWSYFVIIPIFFVIPDSYNMKYLKYMYPFFFAGYLWNKYDGALRLKKFKRSWLLGISALAFGILLLGMNYDTYIYNSGFTILGKVNWKAQVYHDLHRWAIGFAGCIFVCLVIEQMMKCIFVPGMLADKLFTTLGKCSLGLYMFQGFFIQGIIVVALRNYGQSFPGYVVIVETIAVSVACVVVTKLVKKSKLLNMLLLGGR